MSEITQPIPARLRNVAVNGHVAGAADIIDDNLNKTQAVINAEIDEVLGDGGNVAFIDDEGSSPAVVPSFDPESQSVHITSQVLSEQQKAQVRTNIGLNDVDARISNAVNGVESEMNTKFQQYDTAIGALNGSDTVVGALPQSGEANKIYRVPNDPTTNKYTDYGWNGTQFVKLATYPNDVDDEPTAGSDNLVKSGGVVNYVKNHEVVRVEDDEEPDLDFSDESGNVIMRLENGDIKTKNFNSAKTIESETYHQGDFSVVDEYGNIVMNLEKGGIRTKNFDSSPVSALLPSGTIIANEINSIASLGEPSNCLSVTDEEVTTHDNVALGFCQVLKISDSMYYLYYRAVGTDTVVPQGADLSDEKVLNFAYSRDGFQWIRGFPEGITPPIEGVNCCVFYDTDGETLLIKPSDCIFKARWDSEYPFRAVTSEGARPANVYLFKSRDGVTFVEPKLIDPIIRDSQPSVIVRDGILKIYERLQPSDGDRYIVVGYYDYDGNVISPFRYLFGSSCYNSAACMLDERRDILFPTYYPTSASISYGQSVMCFIVDGNVVRKVDIDSDVLTEDGTYQQIYVSPNGLVDIRGELYLFYVVNDRNHGVVPSLSTPYTGRNEIKMVKVTFGNNLHVRQS